MRRIGIVMNGATGRMGRGQHLMAALGAIRAEGGLPLADGTRLMPEPILVGRDRSRLEAVAAEAGIDRISTDLGEALSNTEDAIYFDALPPSERPETTRRAIEAGKHIFVEKPLTGDLASAEEVVALARTRGVKHAMVCDKLWAPGIARLLALKDEGFFGKILMVRIEGCHWAFEGRDEPLQRPSWNYKKAPGGGIGFDMLVHYAYILAAIGGRPLSLVADADTLVKTRWDEERRPYEVDVEDTVLALTRLAGGAMAQVTCSWAVRVRRDDVLTVQVDGSEGSAVAGLSECHVQSRAGTTRAEWSRDGTPPLDYRGDWEKLTTDRPPHPYRVQWEHFLRHVAEDAPFPWDMAAGLEAMRFADACLLSSRERRWIDLPGGSPQKP